MTSYNNNLKVSRVIGFSRKEEDWNKWSKTFLAMATIKGYRSALIPENEDKNISSKDNVRAYSNLIIACQDNVVFGFIEEATSVMFTNGDAKVAWRNLKEKFEPTTGASKI